jgi:N-methylhydantoinase A
MAVCGFLGHLPLAYSSVTMDRARAAASIAPLAETLRLRLEETAEAIIKVAISGMFVEVNKLLGRYGVDPADFALMPFGGAGPMLGCLLARELGMNRVMIPRRPGVVSALGGLIADLKNDFVSTVFVDLGEATIAGLREAAASLRAQAEIWLRDGQGFAGPATRRLLADMRYRGQSFEIEVALDESRIEVASISAAFHSRHQEVYDFADEDAEIQIVNLRLVIAGVTPKPTFLTTPRQIGAPRKLQDVEVWYDGRRLSMQLFLRDDLQHGHCLTGPAIIAQEDTTICIPADFNGEVDAWGNLHLEHAS